jgi:hypothetical protein
MLLQQHFLQMQSIHSLKVLTLLLPQSYLGNGLTLKLIYLELSQIQKRVGAINASAILEANGQVIILL